MTLGASLPAPERLKAYIAKSIELHEEISADPEFARAFADFSAWQKAYIRNEFTHILTDKNLNPAMEFMLNNLAGSSIAERDKDLQRVLPLAIKTLPGHALEAIANAVHLSAITLEMDIAICRELLKSGAEMSDMSERAYWWASREATTLETRLVVIERGRIASEKLDDLMGVRFIGMTIKALKKPAELSGFGGLHTYLHTAYKALKQVPDIPAFLDDIDNTLRALFERVYRSPL